MVEASDAEDRVRAHVVRSFYGMLPGLVYQAHGHVPDPLQSAVSRDDLINVFRASARAGLVKAGCLSLEELKTLHIVEAIHLAQRRFREHHPDLELTPRPSGDPQATPSGDEQWPEDPTRAGGRVDKCSV